MFSYYGSKSKMVDYYPPPKHEKIIEPFAGSARYSLKYFENDILLLDKYEPIIKIWKWLQQCSPNDILKLPNLNTGENIKDYQFDCEEQKLFMGFIIKGGDYKARYTVSPFRGGKLEPIKKKIADNLFKIKHWKIELGTYEELNNENATWFIDPPYQFGGHKYPCSNKKIDYALLRQWIEGRQGQVIVCENTKADWMNFLPLKEMRGTMFKTTEAVWVNNETNYDAVRQTLQF